MGFGTKAAKEGTMALHSNEDALEKIDHLIMSVKEAVQFASDTGFSDHNAGMWSAAVREMEDLPAKRGETWDVVAIRDS